MKMPPPSPPRSVHGARVETVERRNEEGVGRVAGSSRHGCLGATAQCRLAIFSAQSDLARRNLSLVK